jgi:hypothetical protein
MLLAPGGNFEVVYLTEPDVSLSVARTVAPFRYLFLPVGVPANDETVAVKVTGFPDTVRIHGRNQRGRGLGLGHYLRQWS